MLHLSFLRQMHLGGRVAWSVVFFRVSQMFRGFDVFVLCGYRTRDRLILEAIGMSIAPFALSGLILIIF